MLSGNLHTNLGDRVGDLKIRPRGDNRCESAKSLFRSPSKSQSLSVIQMDPDDLCEFSIYTSQEILSRWHWPVHRGSLGHTPKLVNEGALGTANANARGNHPCTSAAAGAAQELSTNETRKSNHRKCEWDPDPNNQKQPPQVRVGSKTKQPKATTANAKWDLNAQLLQNTTLEKQNKRKRTKTHTKPRTKQGNCPSSAEATPSLCHLSFIHKNHQQSPPHRHHRAMPATPFPFRHQRAARSKQGEPSHLHVLSILFSATMTRPLRH